MSSSVIEGKYEIYLGAAPGAYDLTPVEIITGANSYYTVTGLANGTMYYFAIKGSDAGGYSGYSNEVNATPKSSNAKLSSLILSNGTLNELFDANMPDYMMDVPSSVGSVNVTASTDNPTASMTVNGTTATSGSMSDAISLDVGSNTITIVVTAQDGISTRTYTVTVNRPSDLVVTSAQADATGQTVGITFSEPLVAESIAAGTFLLYVGGKPIAVTQADLVPSESKINLTVNGPLYKWDRITLDIQGGVIQSVHGSQLVGITSTHVENIIEVYSPVFTDTNDIHIGNIIAFLNSRNYDVDVDGDGISDSEVDIKMLLSQINRIH